MSKQQDKKLYPNPISLNQVLNLAVPANIQNFQVTVYNIMGYHIFTEAISAKDGFLSIPIKETLFQKGNYFIRISSNEGFLVNEGFIVK